MTVVLLEYIAVGLEATLVVAPDVLSSSSKHVFAVNGPNNFTEPIKLL